MAMEYNAKINKKNDIAGKNYHRRPKKKNTNPQKHPISKKMRIFAVAFNSQESSKQEKHCDKVPFTEFRQSSYGGDEHFFSNLSVLKARYPINPTLSDRRERSVGLL